MVFKKYVCKGCGNTEELELDSFCTYPQCGKCYGIMAEHIEYVNAPIAKFIPDMQVLWAKHWPDVPVHVQLIYNNHLFKFRWFDGPTAKDVRSNSEFMCEYNKICNAAGVPERRRTHGRVFKQYLGAVPSKLFLELSEQDQSKVKKLIEKHIITFYKEMWSAGTTLGTHPESGPILLDCRDIQDEMINSKLSHYVCTKCNIVIKERKTNSMTSDETIIQHIIGKHLSEYDGELCENNNS